jgi:hypothetical protein
MKELKIYLEEREDFKGYGSINFNGETFQFDKIIGSNVHADTDKARTIKSFTDDMWNDLKKQGVKFVLCFPPHYTQSNEKVDEFIIKMFIKKKKMYDMYKGGERYALYSTKTGECVNKEIMNKGKAYKVIRFE